MSDSGSATFSRRIEPGLPNGSFATSGKANVTVNSTFVATNSALPLPIPSQFKPSSTANISRRDHTRE